MSFLPSQVMLIGLALPALAVGVSPTTVSGSDSSSTVTSNTATASVTGGSGTSTKLWERVSGSTAITATSGTFLATTFTTTGLGSGASVSAVFRCKVTDTITGEVAYSPNVSVYLERSNPPLSASVSGSGVKTLTSSSTITVTSDGVTGSGSGGVPPYTHSHAHLTANDFSINAPGSATTTHSRALGPGGGVSGTVRYTVTDAIGQTATADYGVVLINNGSPPPPLSASANPSSVGGSGIGSDSTVYSEVASITVSGAVGSVSISWARIGGVGTATGGFDSQFYHSFFASGSASGTFQATVTDSLGRTATATVTASWLYYAGGIEP